jgi:hypothetical protein
MPGDSPGVCDLRLALRLTPLMSAVPPGASPAEQTDGDYCYTLLTINGVSFHTKEKRDESLRSNDQLLKWFDDCKPSISTEEAV